MEIYLILTHKGYELYSAEPAKDEPAEKGLANKIKRLYEKLVTNHEKVLRSAGKTKEEIILNYPSDIPEKWGRDIYLSIIKKEKTKNIVYFTINSVLAPVTFVAAPVLPVINWGMAAFFAYKCATHYKALHGIRKIEKSNCYKPNKNLSELENVLIEHKDYSKLAEKAEAIGCKDLALFYTKRSKKKVKKIKFNR